MNHLKITLRTNNFQTVPIEFVFLSIKENNFAAFRDYLYWRQVSKGSCGHFKPAEHPQFGHSQKLSRLLKLGWILRVSRGHYRIVSLYDLVKGYGITDRKTIRNIHLNDITAGSVRRFKAFILAKAEAFVGRRKYRAVNYMKRKKLLQPENLFSPDMSFQIARDTLLKEKGTLGKLSNRHMEEVTGMHFTTINKIRKEFNGEYKKYRRSHCILFDRLRLTCPSQVEAYIESICEGKNERESNMHRNIYFSKSKGHYRKVVSTEVKIRVDQEFGVLHKKHMGIEELEKVTKYLNLENNRDERDA